MDLILQGKNSNAVLPRKEKRDEWINRLLEVENDGPKHADNYNLKRRYEVLKVDVLATRRKCCAIPVVIPEPHARILNDRYC